VDPLPEDYTRFYWQLDRIETTIRVIEKICKNRRE
jgi:hypothetical protein